MSWLTNLFRGKSKLPSEEGRKWVEGRIAFEKGETYFRNGQDAEALTHFDKAIECGFENNVYELRALCLQTLNFDLDAIDDFNMAIASSQHDCNLYFSRSNSKSVIEDFEGCVADLEEAIRLSAIDNDLNRNYSIAAKEQGYRDGHTVMYKMKLLSAKIRLKREQQDRNLSEEMKVILKGSKKEKIYKRR